MSKIPYNIDDIRQALHEGRIFWREHVLERMLERDISKNDIKNCIENGKIIEEYVDDFPFPSCLVFGYTINNRPIHVVCSINGGIVYIITAYEPELFKWHNDFETRRN